MRRERSFYLFFMITACISTLVFGGYYFKAGIAELYVPTLSAFLLFAIYSALSFLPSVSLVWLFRVSVVTTLVAFYNRVYFTGGIQSHALMEFVIPPLLAFFYRPVRDRYIFMVISAACLISMYPLTNSGYAKDLLPSTFGNTHALMCAIFIYTIVSIYTIFFDLLIWCAVCHIERLRVKVTVT